MDRTPVELMADMLFDAEYYRMLGYSIRDRAAKLIDNGYAVVKEDLNCNEVVSDEKR